MKGYDTEAKKKFSRSLIRWSSIVETLMSCAKMRALYNIVQFKEHKGSNNKDEHNMFEESLMHMPSNTGLVRSFGQRRSIQLVIGSIGSPPYQLVARL